MEHIEYKNKVETILARYPKDKSSIIAVLQDINAEFHFLPCEAVSFAAASLGIPRTKAFSIATFYKAFNLKPGGKNIICVCKGTACHIKGAEKISEELERLLGVKSGETTKDLKFTIQEVNCVGACAMAPVVLVNEKYYGDVKPDSLEKIITK